MATSLNQSDLGDSRQSIESVQGMFNKELEEEPEMRAAFEELMNNQITSQKVTIKKVDKNFFNDLNLEDKIQNRGSFKNQNFLVERSTSIPEMPCENSDFD